LYQPTMRERYSLRKSIWRCEIIATLPAPRHLPARHCLLARL
jgi:hypothetical protein